MRYVSGKVLTGEGFMDGHVAFEDGLVVEVAEGRAPRSEAEGIVVPTLVNAHTHIADYVVKVDLSLPLEELVGPPDGLKHRVLRETPDDLLIRGMDQARALMLRRGASRFLDFREGGERGAKLLRRAQGWPRPFIMGRPLHLRYDREEVDRVLAASDGIGVSSLSDWDYQELRGLAAHVRSRGKPFAIHVSERDREDIGRVLDLRPSFVVHMTEAAPEDLEACVAAEVPIVSCPRSNLFSGREPPLAGMLRAGAQVALGTDNAMFNLPDMLAEMEAAARLLRRQGWKDVGPVLSMALENGAKLLMGKVTIGIAAGQPCDFLVARSHQGDPITDLVLRGSSSDPLMVCLGKETWRGGP